MRVRTLLFAAAATLLVASPSFAQRGGGGFRTGTVKSIDAAGKSVVVTTMRMNQAMDVTIQVNDQTQLGRVGGATVTLADIKAGNHVVFMGGGAQGAPGPARVIFVSDKEVRAVPGTVKSADAGAKTIVVTTMGRGGAAGMDVTVKVSDATKYLSGRNAAKWEDVTAGKRVAIIGEGRPQAGMTAMHVIILPEGAGGNN